MALANQGARRSIGKRRLTLIEALELLRPVAQALDYAWVEHKLVHRDLKPDNLFISEPGGVIKLLDFGLAARMRSSASNAGIAVLDRAGTLDYAPPEAAAKQKAWHPSHDVYSLAVVLYQMLDPAHELPFQKRAPGTAWAVQPVGLSDAQWEVLKWGLAYRQDERSPTAGAFLDALEGTENVKQRGTDGGEKSNVDSVIGLVVVVTFVLSWLVEVGVAFAGGFESASQPAPALAPAAAPAQPLVVKLGHVGPLTGGIGFLGKDNENGARLAVDEANAKGLKLGGQNVKLELIAEDDQGNPKVGTTVAQKLVDAKIAGVVGHLNPGASMPSSAIYNRAGIPMISGSSTNPELTEQGFKTVFRVIGRDDQQGPAIASYLVGEIKPKTVAVIDDATAYGEDLANEVEKTLKAAGVEILPREKGTDMTTNFAAILTKIKDMKPDAVFYGGMDATGGPLLKQGREIGIKAVFAFGDGACTDSMAKLAGDAAEGLLCSQNGIPIKAASKKFLDAYAAKFKVEPILYAPFTYDAANLLIEAMKKANSPDPAKFLPELAKISYQGATGKIEFDEKGDRRDAEVTIFTMKGGKIEPIAIIKGGKTTR